MSDVETKRRGRPPKAQPIEDAPAAVEADAKDDAVPVAAHDGPPCPFCGRPRQRSTRLLRRYELTALRCDRCKEVAIEGDAGRWDTLTAISGNPPPIVVRAMTLYEARHHIQPPPPAVRDRSYEAMTSEWGDERWVEVDL